MRRMSTERPARSDLIAAIVKAGSLKETAAALGVSRMTLYRWCRDLKIDVRRGVVIEEAA